MILKLIFIHHGHMAWSNSGPSNRPWLRSANEGVLPFYILHQTVPLVIGYFVVAWEIHDIAKWAIVFTSSFVVIIPLYMLFIRKFYGELAGCSPGGRLWLGGGLR